MTIRPFVESDRSALRKIYLEARRHTFGWMDCSLIKEDDFDRDTEGEIIWVATDNEEDNPVGFISIWKPDDFVHSLYVHPKEIGQGIGSALLKECLKNIGRPASLKCAEQNTKARDFYLSKGWKTVSNGENPEGKYHLMHFKKKT